MKMSAVGGLKNIFQRDDLEKPVHGSLQRAESWSNTRSPHARAGAQSDAAEPLAHVTVTTHDGDFASPIINVRWRGGCRRPSDSLQPYLLSNFDLVTESLTLIAGKGSWPFFLQLVETVHTGGCLFRHAP